MRIIAKRIAYINKQREKKDKEEDRLIKKLLNLKLQLKNAEKETERTNKNKKDKNMADHSECGKGFYKQCPTEAMCGHVVPHGGLRYCKKCAKRLNLCRWCGQKNK